MSTADHGANREAARSLRRKVRAAEDKLSARNILDRWHRICLVALAGLLLIGGVASIVSWGKGVTDRIDFACGFLVACFGLTGLGTRAWAKRNSMPSGVLLEIELEQLRDSLRWAEAGNDPGISVSQKLYKADIAVFIEQYQRESEKYRKTHNRLQSLIIVGSLSTTTVAALNGAIPSGRWITVSLSFAVGLAAGFMGYFKFRERSFYLQQTADQIEHEVNAMALAVGEYRGRERSDALAFLVERVESIRNEQRRRQQQLDQPADTQPTTSE